jgi:outer membrane receptor for ferric coprogen and ferric-rhodotorulic acid
MTDLRQLPRTVLLPAIACCWSLSGHGAARVDEQPTADTSVRHVRIERRALTDALQEFARQSGFQVIFFSELTEGMVAPALDGQYTLETAMRTLLSRSHLAFRIINPKTVQVLATTPRVESSAAPASAVDARERPSTAESLSAPLEEITVLGATEGLVATRAQTPWREIPQTISIITHEQIRQQNDVDLADVLRHATGVIADRLDSLDETFYSRGFAITTFHIDGGAALSDHYGGLLAVLAAPDMSEFERVEVLRGADALFGGEGNPGATVNLIRKRPRASTQSSVDIASGSWNDHRFEADLTGPVALDGALRGRVDVVGTDQDYFYDIATLQRRKISGALEYDLTPTTLLTLGGSYQRDDGAPVSSGVPLYADGRDAHLPRTATVQFDWASYHSRIAEAYLKLSQSINDGWSLRINGSAFRGTVAESTALFPTRLDPVTREVSIAPLIVETTHPNPFRQLALDATLNGVTQWFGRRQEIAVGADITRRTQRPALRTFAQPPLAVDIGNIDVTGYPHPDSDAIPELIGRSTQTDSSYGAFVSMRAWLDDDWSVVAGARVSSGRLELDAKSVLLGVIPIENSSRLHDSRVVTPYAGVMYAPNQNYSLYASYADIFAASGANRRADGTLLGPSHGENAELGVKGVWRNGRLNGALTVYRIEQDHVPVLDVTHSSATTGVPTCCFRAEDNRSTGFDLELSGSPIDRWRFGGGYTFNINHAASGDGPLSPITPHHLLKLWTSAQLAGSLERLSLGAAVYAQSAAAKSLLARRVDEQSAYAIADVRASVQLNASWLLALNVNNVFDRVYYENSASLAGLWYGTPRGYLLQLSGHF